MHNDDKTTIPPTDIYREHYATYRQLNAILYQFPILFSTILGGLYYFGFSYIDSNRYISIFVFLFSSLISLTFLLMVRRFREAFRRYINKINEFDGEHKITLNDVQGVSILEGLRRLLWALMAVGPALSLGAYLSLFDANMKVEEPSFICNNCVLQNARGETHGLSSD